jgi:uncharacterized protein (DUF2336 family)
MHRLLARYRAWRLHRELQWWFRVYMNVMIDHAQRRAALRARYYEMFPPEGKS